MAAWNIFAQADVKDAEFPGGTIGGNYLWSLLTAIGDEFHQTSAPMVNIQVDVPDGETRSYTLTFQRLDAASAPLGGLLVSDPFSAPPPPQPVVISVADTDGAIGVVVTPVILEEQLVAKKR